MTTEEKIGYAPAGVAETFSLDWSQQIVAPWRPEHEYAQGAIVRIEPGNGFLYEATEAGISAYLKPEFPPVSGETVNDGSVIWTARHPDTPALETITDSDWDLDDGATEQDSDIDGLVTSITVIGDTPGERYRMTNRITRSTGEVEVDSIVLEVLDPPDV